MSTLVNRHRLRVRLWITCGLILGITSVWHYTTLYRDVSGARAALVTVERQIGAPGFHVSRADVDDAERILDGAQRQIEDARTHARWDPLLQIARRMPFMGKQVDAGFHLLDIAATLVDMGRETTSITREALAATEEDHPQSVPTAAVALLDRWAPSIRHLQSLGEQAVETRIQIGDDALVGPLNDARSRLDAVLPQMASALDQATTASSVLPDLLGYEGERRYLLLSLNNAELMPGGGLVTVAGVVEFERGRVVSTEFRDTRSWIPDWAEQGGPYIAPPGPLQRYLLKDYPWNLGVSNWDPDFPTWARQALEFYELAWGPQDVDGVVAVDIEVLETLLSVTGPKTVAAPGFGNIRVTSEDAFVQLEEITRPPSGTWQRSKTAVGELQRALLQDILALPPRKWADLAGRIRRVAEGRHLQVLLFDPQAQGLVARLGWDGALRLPPSGDYLQFNEASVNSTKLNYVFVPEATYRIDVSELGTARHELELRYHNPVRQWAAGRDPLLVSRLMYDGQYGGYLRAFVPLDAMSFSATVDGRVTGIEDQETTAHQQWFGVFLPVAPDATREVTLSWSVPFATHDSTNYELFIQKQAGTRGLCLDLAVLRGQTSAATLEVIGGSTDAQGRHCLTSDITVRATFEQR